MQLTKRKPTDAMGAVLDPEALYTPINPFARGQHEVYNPELTQLRGSHAGVIAAPQLWIRADASTDEKRRALIAYRAAKEAAQPTTTPEVAPPTRVLGPIPQERRRVALRNYHDRAGRVVHEGSIWDAHDPFVKANGDMFGPDEAA